MTKTGFAFLKNKWVQNFFYLMIVASVCAWIYVCWKERKEALKDPVFVRVKIEEVIIGHKGGPLFIFKYQINDTTYEGDYAIVNGNELEEYKKLRAYKGDFFYVKVARKKPEYNQLLIDNEVVDTTLKQPVSGWKELPEKVKSKYKHQDGNDFFSGT